MESNRNTILVSHAPDDKLGENARPYATCDEHDCLYSSHYGVSEYTLCGDVLRVFGGRLVQMERPGYFTTDSTGRILVVDRTNNRIIMLDSALQFMRVLVLTDDEVPDYEIVQMALGGSPCRLFVTRSLTVFRVLTSDRGHPSDRIELEGPPDRQ